MYYNYDYYRAKGQVASKKKTTIKPSKKTSVSISPHQRAQMPQLIFTLAYCLDILRQQLMCTVDRGVFGRVWVQTDPKEAPFTYVNFNTAHLCRNFGDVRNWAEER